MALLVMHVEGGPLHLLVKLKTSLYIIFAGLWIVLKCTGWDLEEAIWIDLLAIVCRSERYIIVIVMD